MLKELNSIAANMLGLQGFPMVPFSRSEASSKATAIEQVGNDRSAQSGIEPSESPAVQEKDQTGIAA